MLFYEGIAWHKYRVKISEFSYAPVKKINSWTGRKSFYFENSINYTSSRSPQRYCLAERPNKTPQTQHIQRDICANTQEQKAKSKNKFIHWVASQQALSFMPLARHNAWI